MKPTLKFYPECNRCNTQPLLGLKELMENKGLNSKKILTLEEVKLGIITNRLLVGRMFTFRKDDNKCPYSKNQRKCSLNIIEFLQ